MPKRTTTEPADAEDIEHLKRVTSDLRREYKERPTSALLFELNSWERRLKRCRERQRAAKWAGTRKESSQPLLFE